MTRPPLGHTIVVLASLTGCFAVLMVYAATGQEPPVSITTLIVALATGSSATYLAPRPTAPPAADPGPGAAPDAPAVAGDPPPASAGTDPGPASAGPSTP